MLDTEVKGGEKEGDAAQPNPMTFLKGVLCLEVNLSAKWKCLSVQRCIPQARSSLKGNEGKRTDY